MKEESTYKERGRKKKIEDESESTCEVISDITLKRIEQTIYLSTGIKIKDGEHLTEVIQKITPLIKSFKCTSIIDLLNRIDIDPQSEIACEIANRITTNYSYFYREKIHLEFLFKKGFPDLINAKKKECRRSISIWSAACSSGEEPYTLSMLLREFFGTKFDDWKIKIFATDISKKVLEEASNGIYGIDKLQDTPKTWKSDYFDHLRESDDTEKISVKPFLKECVFYDLFNLKTGNYSSLEKFDIIFCRNVFIYFDQITIDEITLKIIEHLEKDGYFFIGVSETLGNKHKDKLEFIAPGIYRKII